MLELTNCCMRNSKMRKLLMLVLLMGALLLRKFSIPVTATNYNEAAELHRSMARYRQLFDHEQTKPVMRELLQVEEKIKGKLRSSGEANMVEHAKQVQQGQDLVAQRKQRANESSIESQTDEKEVEGTIMKRSTNQTKSKQKGPDKDGEVGKNKTEEQLQEEGQKGGINGTNSEHTDEFVFPEPHLIGPTIKDWDEQRAEWLDQNPQFQSSVSKPKVLIVTGSQPEPCPSAVGDYFHIQSLKLKIDYARLHNYEIYYSMVNLDPKMHGYWVKLPLIRKLMLTHPEIEWFFWMDSDAIFTDMLFELPFHTYEGYDMVMWGWNKGVYEQKMWTAFNDGSFIIRNSQWSLDLIDKWSPFGENGQVNVEYGKVLTAYLHNRGDYKGSVYPADDQGTLCYLMLTDEAVRARVKLVEDNEYYMSGWYVTTMPLYNTSMERYHPGFGDHRWPFVTHFSGCSPCGGEQVSDTFKKCMGEFNISYNFADNQVLAYMGFQYESLYSSTLKRTLNETGRPLELASFNPYEERIAEVAARDGNSLSK